MTILSHSNLGGITKVCDVDHNPETNNTDVPGGSIINYYTTPVDAEPVYQTSYLKLSDGDNQDVEEIKRGPVYGNMYQRDNGAATTINSLGVFEEVLNFLSGELKKVTFDSSILTTPDDGRSHPYNLSYSACVANGTGKTFETAIEVDGTVRDESLSCTTIPVGGNPDGIGGGFPLTIGPNKDIKLVIRNLSGNQNVTVIHASMMLTRIGL